MTDLVKLRNVIDENEMVMVLYENRDKYKLPEYIVISGPETETYNTISKWCGRFEKFEKVKNHPSFSSTCNGILYHDNDNVFLNTDVYNHSIAFDFSAVIPVWKDLNLSINYDDVLWVPEYIFESGALDELEKKGAISNAIEISREFIQKEE